MHITFSYACDVFSAIVTIPSKFYARWSSVIFSSGSSFVVLPVLLVNLFNAPLQLYLEAFSDRIYL
jgi:hypothetical protein